MENNSQLLSKNTSYLFRGIAILMVVCSHYFEWGQASIPNAGLVAFMEKLGDPGVAIFFLMSGYALQKGYGNIRVGKRYLLSRIKNFYLPYLFIGLVIYSFAGGLHSLSDVAGLLTGHDFWFIRVILILYIAYFLVGQLPRCRILIMTVFVFGLSAFYYIKGYAVFWYDVIWCFALGLIISESEKFLKLKKGIDIKDYVLVFWGKLSLYIYLWHSFIYFELMNTQIMLSMEASWYIKSVICFVCTYAVAYATEHMFSLIYRIPKLLKSKKELTGNNKG